MPALVVVALQLPASNLERIGVRYEEEFGLDCRFWKMKIGKIFFVIKLRNHFVLSFFFSPYFFLPPPDGLLEDRHAAAGCLNIK